MSSEALRGPLADCTAFQIDILLALTDEYQSGADVRDQLTTRHGEVTHGNLYMNLDTLAEDGLVAKERHYFDARTNGYALTERGETVLGLYARYVQAHADGGQQ